MKKNYNKRFCSSCDKHRKLYKLEWKTQKEKKTTYHCKECIESIEQIIVGVVGARQTMENFDQIREELIEDIKGSIS